ncbi:MAG: 23S rRNA (adenine(2503)-C(2))-methyltransferase RlmN [Clostridiales bacterium]|jgi:23S rRNA (adenine2503-C2)-methyltransferase|nr:23S rRNA (adenine(2503)-C(2))-methyltransferase RlmN [Clostridiales bacterium]
MDIASMTSDEIAELIGDKPYRGKQIFRWIHGRQAESFDAMTDLPKTIREKLKLSHTIGSYALKLRSVQSADQTTKYLFQMDNNTIIESVYMSYRFGGSVCASTQAGCRLGCAFCASGKSGLERNLAPSEICGQVYAIQREKPRVGHVVLMGSGEPLDNYESTVRFIKLISDENGQRMSRRSITVSTCGLTPRIINLADEMLPVTLAVSLHAPDDAARERLMPVARVFPMRELLRACEYYADKTGRQVTYEYTMIKGVNDSLSQAKELAARLKGTLSHVNLIRLNELEDLDWNASSEETIRRFADTLNGCGVKTTVRRALGGGISAACGQLRNHHNNTYSR